MISTSVFFTYATSSNHKYMYIYITKDLSKLHLSANKVDTLKLLNVIYKSFLSL